MAEKVIYYALLPLLLLSTIAFSLSEPGGACADTSDCRVGYCHGQECKVPESLQNFTVKGSCAITADCAEGYCSGGICFVPKPKGAAPAVFSVGPKPGCTGFLENCSGIICTLCDGIWLLVAAGSAIAGYLGLKKGGQYLPLAAAIVPIAIAALFLPMLGFLIALTEILLLALLREDELILLSELFKLPDIPIPEAPKLPPTLHIELPLPPINLPPAPDIPNIIRDIITVFKEKVEGE